MSNIKIICLGAGQHVGKSCIFVSFGDKNVLLDCGLHMSQSNEKKYPNFKLLTNKNDLSQKIDCVIITHLS